MSDKAKRRWYQFSLCTLLALVTVAAIGVATGIAWWNHPQFCLERAEYHRRQENFQRALLKRPEDMAGGPIPKVYPAHRRHNFMNVESYVLLRRRGKEHEAAIEEQHRLAVLYNQAVWFPWLRSQSEPVPGESDSP